MLGDAGRRADQVTRCEHGFERLGIRRIEQLDAEAVSARCPFVGHHVVTGDHVPAPLPQRTSGGCPGDSETVDERAHHTDRLEKSAMKMPSARPTEIAAISQKRMITVVSGQPTSSKWWWIGDIRKSRFLRPEALNTPI